MTQVVSLTSTCGSVRLKNFWITGFMIGRQIINKEVQCLYTDTTHSSTLWDPLKKKKSHERLAWPNRNSQALRKHLYAWMITYASTSCSCQIQIDQGVTHRRLLLFFSFPCAPAWAFRRSHCWLFLLRFRRVNEVPARYGTHLVVEAEQPTEGLRRTCVADAQRLTCAWE